MNELIHITEHNGKKAVSARELYEKLGFNSTHWAKWYKKNIIENPYAVENEDWQGFALSANGNATRDFVLTLDFAKKLSMLARTDAGEKIRNYFVEVEKAALTALKTIEPEELLLRQAQMLVDQKKRLVKVEEDVKMLQARTTTRPDYFTVAGYANLHGQRINLRTASRIGTRAASLCRKNSYQMGECEDPRFGRVRTYPREILDEVFAEPVM